MMGFSFSRDISLLPSVASAFSNMPYASRSLLRGIATAPTGRRSRASTASTLLDSLVYAIADMRICGTAPCHVAFYVHFVSIAFIYKDISSSFVVPFCLSRFIHHIPGNIAVLRHSDPLHPIPTIHSCASTFGNTPPTSRLSLLQAACSYC